MSGVMESQTHMGRHPTVRTLKIEADGDVWKGLIKPKIRLVGRWLEQAGFSPGLRVQVMCVAPGVIELRAPDASLARVNSQELLGHSKEPF